MTAHGGARPNSGRPKGSTNAKTAALARKLSAEGLTPLEYMLGLLRDEDQSPAVRFDAAKSAAPYIHPRLANIEANVKATVSQEDALAALAAMKDGQQAADGDGETRQ